MFKKILLVLSVCLLLAVGIVAQDDSGAAAKTDKTDAKASTSETTKPAAFRPTKDQIKKGQEVLIEKKLWDGEATGIYGECRPAIKAYQKQNGLEQTGKFDKATLTKMGIPLTDKQKGTSAASDSKSAASSTTKSSSTAPSSDDPKKPGPFQATKDQIKALQTKLKEAKLFSGDADGERSDDLKEAVKKYQDANGLKATGGINAATLEKAGIALNDKQKANVAAQKAYDEAKKD